MHTWTSSMALLGLAAVALLPATALPLPLDRDGCRDSPLLRRAEGCYIVDCRRSAWEEAKLLVGAEGKEEAIEGESEQLLYYCPQDFSQSKVVRNAEAALREAGFAIVFSGKDRSGDAAVTARLGGQWVAVRTGSGRYWLRMVKTKEPVPEMAKARDPAQEALKAQAVADEALKAKEVSRRMVAEAAVLAKALGATGHTTVYGISFEDNKAEVKPDSETALKVVAALLAENPQMKVFVVVHGEMKGDESREMELSRARADAVVAALVSKHGVDRPRLEPRGVGPLAPVATNRTEDGRAQNRRVELVER